MGDIMLSENEFNRIMDKFAGSIFRLAMVKTRNKQDAEDVFQDVFMKLYKSGKTFESDDHIKAWLIKVTVNTSLDLLKTFWHNHIVELDAEIPFQDESDHFLWEEIKKLSEKYRIPVHLYYYEGYSTDEIAEILHEKPATTRSKLHRGRIILSERMGDSYEWI